MYVNPFWFGVCAGIVATLIFIVVLASNYTGGKK